MRAKLFALLFLGLLAVLLAPSGCATNVQEQPDTGPPVEAGPPNPCGPGSAKQCNGTCVDVAHDTQNCGDCGVVCPSDKAFCSGGTCAAVCGGGTAHCGNNCVDLKSDPLNCGGCGTKCPSGEVCNKATCALTCQAGLTDCNGGCVDTTSDDFNCGACGNACPGGKACVNSSCQATCQAGWSSCPDGTDGGTTCVDTTNDPNNCNSCGNKCPNGYFCQNGVCGIQCAGGTSKCNNTCVDEAIDSKNCGSCGFTCGSGTACSGAHCCPTATPFWCPAEAKCDTLVNCVLKSGGAITAGQSHTCAINPSGAERCWGYSGNGELGNNGSTATSKTPITPSNGSVTLSSGVVATAAWYYGACATLTSGAEYCWGYNVYGQCGNGLTTTTYKPVQVTGISTGVLPAGGGYYGGNCVLLKSGAVSCWGYDEYGQVCQGSVTFNDYTTPQTTQVTSGAIGLYGSSTNFYGQICQVTAGGAVSCWGEGYYTLGDGTTYESGTPITVKNVSNVASVANGEESTCVVMKDGTMKCWGYNFYGQNGDGTTTTTYNPSATTTASVTGVIQAAVGYEHTCVVTTSGAVKCVGYNGYGQLGNGSTTNSTSWVTAIASGAISVACGGYHSCALMANGTVQCWGNNGSGQLGDNGACGTSCTTPVTVSGF